MSEAQMEILRWSRVSHNAVRFRHLQYSAHRTREVYVKQPCTPSFTDSRRVAQIVEGVGQQQCDLEACMSSWKVVGVASPLRCFQIKRGVQHQTADLRTE
eukprot:CAMPEP_0198581520 /NCGR_PEP_ID=MMETSP1462-20131121/124336_1 /TAXON_ID=1333877 /ORGANISM="Brandtodinium nutriculum, Strain RCC3387" /LENGTH=99 /DNA_ID=CAMNT_0044312897 /DNA_START=34 /DNA_END=330 /DNA_ORIENTATION=+